MTSYEPVMDAPALERFLEEEFSEVLVDGRIFTVTDVRPGGLVMRLDPLARHLRPGGTISGPTMFALADVSAYLAILAHIGPVKHTVTTSLNINFMHKPKPGPLFGRAKLLKLGRKLAVVECHIVDEDDQIVSQATATYSIPTQNDAVK